MLKGATPLQQLNTAISSTRHRPGVPQGKQSASQSVDALANDLNAVKLQHQDWVVDFQDHPAEQRHQPHHPDFDRIFDHHQKMHPTHPGPLPAADWQSEFLNQPPSMEATDAGNFDASLDSAFQRVMEESWGSQMNVGVHPDLDAAWDSIERQQNTTGSRNFEQLEELERAWAENENESFAPKLSGEDLFETTWDETHAFNELDDLVSSPAAMRFQSRPYEFEPNNPYLSHANPFQVGVDIMQRNGSLTAAALAFEAAVQKDARNSEAWTWLGSVQAENEKEHPAIAALEQAAEVDPQNLRALLALAVSYTNENFDHQALEMLVRWIRSKYPDLPKPAEDTTSLPLYALQQYVTQLFTTSAHPEDPDVQVGLGVLHYNMGDYDKAIDSFNQALEKKPDDYMLWNRLGATLANSGRSEEAIGAYHQALSIKPSFVRGRYNLGISCINIGCYREAAEHLLGALSMHQLEASSQRGTPEVRNVSNNIWETLRRTFIMMERRDLADKAQVGADVNIFRNEFEF